MTDWWNEVGHLVYTVAWFFIWLFIIVGVIILLFLILAGIFHLASWIARKRRKKKRERLMRGHPMLELDPKKADEFFSFKERTGISIESALERSRKHTGGDENGR